MSEYPSGTFQFAERIMELNVEQAHRVRESIRLQRQVAAGQRSGQAWYRRALAWLGGHLISWGQRLQERYSTEHPARQAQSANGLAGR